MTDTSGSGNDNKKTVKFDYIKATNFSSLRADGVIGGITPSNRIHMAIYSERPAIPRRTVMELLDDGQVGNPVEVETRGSIVREMSADIFLDLETADAISNWLRDQVEELKRRIGETNE